MQWIRISLIVIFLSGCTAVVQNDDPDYFSRLWEDYKSHNVFDNPKAFQEYKEQKKDKRQNLHEYIEKTNEGDHAKKLFIGWVDSSAFLLTKALVPMYSETMFLTSAYLIEDYSFEIPLGQEH